METLKLNLEIRTTKSTKPEYGKFKINEKWFSKYGIKRKWKGGKNM